MRFKKQYSIDIFITIFNHFFCPSPRFFSVEKTDAAGKTEKKKKNPRHLSITASYLIGNHPKNKKTKKRKNERTKTLRNG